jgi:non-homologous end joining protein Ku
VQFADDSAIDPMYVDRAYYLAPDGKMAGEASPLSFGTVFQLRPVKLQTAG